MLELKDTKATVRSINPRVENHGDETKLAVDIGLEHAFSNQKLDLLDKGLLPSLYKRDANAESDAQEVLDMEDRFLPHLRFPLLGSIPWDYEGDGYTFELNDDGLFDTDAIKLGGCKVNKFQFECEEGGTIKLRYRVQGYPTEEMIGELCHYIKHDVLVSLIPPQAEDDPQSDIEDDQQEAA